MTRSNALFRKRWPAVAVVAAVLAVALVAGTLFAANGRQPQPELPAQSPPPVSNAAAPETDAEIPAAPPAPESVFAQPGDDGEQIETDLPPIVKVPPQHPKLDANLNDLVEQADALEQQPNTPGEGGSGDATTPAEPVLVTFYVAPEQIAAVQQFLEDNDVFVRKVGEDYIEAHVPPGLLVVASEQPGVLRVDTVIPPRPLQSQSNSISQGVGLHGADAWHSAGYQGEGVKVGVIDLGFEGFRQLQGSDLPRNVTARCYFEEPRQPSSRLADCGAEEEHGTAVSDTLLDVAPSAELYIANPFSYGDLRDTVNWMIDNNVAVINRSLSDAYQGPGDGTSPFRNSIFDSIDAAVSGGIVFVNAAGNEAHNVWYGAFNDPDDDNVHNFTSQDVGNTFYLPFDEDDERRSRVTAIMRWDDSWGGADCDLDLLLVRSIPGPDNDVIVAQDIAIEDGDADDFPFAWVRVETLRDADAGNYFLAITKGRCANEPAWIQLTAWMADELQYYSTARSINGTAESRNPGMLAVGATHYWDTDSIAYYSSRGPTLDGRTKPDITGVACARSAVYTLDPSGRCWFGGTSQAAPHVAGLAALVKQRFPNHGPLDVASYLKQYAAERGRSGVDNTWGHGFATLPAVQSAQPTPVQPTRPAPELAPTGNIAVRDGASRGEVIVSWDAVPGATYYRIGYVNMETDYPLATASITGEWLEAFVYVDVNAVNLPPANGRVEYTLRRLEPGVRHAITVLTSNDVVNTKERFGGQYFWPSNPRWRFHTVR